MTKVVLHVRLLDGLIAASGSGVGKPLGVAGECLRAWASGPDADRAPM